MNVRSLSLLPLLGVLACSDRTPVEIEPPPLREEIALVPREVSGVAGLVAEDERALPRADDQVRLSFPVEADRPIVRFAVTRTDAATRGVRYALLRPDGAVEVSGEGLPIGRVRRLAPGTWTLSLLADASGEGGVAYRAQVQLLAGEDLSEPNDDAPPAGPQLTLDAAEATALVSKLEWEGDADTFSVDLPSWTEPTVLRYRLEPAEPTGRYPALPAADDRTVALFASPPGATVDARRTACVEGTAFCPAARAGTSASALAARDEGCAASEPLCLLSFRGVAGSPAQALEGTVAVPSHTSRMRFTLRVASASGRFADDRRDTLSVRWERDPDEQLRQGDGTEKAIAATLKEDTSSGPVPPTDLSYAVSGTLLAGHGALSATPPAGVLRGPDDYDAFESDVDVYQFQLPSLPPPESRRWKVQWDVEPEGAHGLQLALEFCDGDRLTGGGACTPVTVDSAGAPLVLRHSAAPALPWHASLTGVGPLMLSTQASSAGALVTTVSDEACSCLEPRFVRGGTLTVRVSAIDRLSYAPARYTLRTAYAPWPSSFTTAGQPHSCPEVCELTRAP